jgi:hypothetical protein
MRPTATVLLVGAALLCARPATADNVLPGDDLFEIQPGSSHTFGGPYAIPADFFGPGSDPFVGTVNLSGLPLAPQPSCPEPLGNTAVLMRRPLSAQLPVPPATDTVPIEIVALSLVSIEPIVVTYNGGQNPQQWNVKMELSSTGPPPPSGSMTPRHTDPVGGTFDSQFYVQPLFTFNKVQPQPEPPRVMDFGASSFFDVFFEVDIPWSHSGPATLQHPSCSSNFRPTVVGGTQVVTAPLVGPFTHLLLQWTPGGGPVPEGPSTWGALKASYQ